MADTDREHQRKETRTYAERVEAGERRKMKAREEGDRGVWFGLGMFGLVGWAVAVPTLIGTAVGLWLDKQLESTRSWTLMLLVIGVILGCLNAWFWVKRESRHD
jgi:ATP synthase protein I